MAGYRKRNTEGPSSEDKALDLFAEMMIEKIESIHKDWHKPWFTEGALQWPRNLSGREYNGMNALMLLLHCENEGYKIPRFCTFDCVQRLNKPGKDGQELPRVSVLRGEKSFPVMLTTFTCIHKETKEKIKYDDYKKLSDEEKAQYNVYPKMQVFRVFNVAQTNLQEARPELWEQLESVWEEAERQDEAQRPDWIRPFLASLSRMAPSDRHMLLCGEHLWAAHCAEDAYLWYYGQQTAREQIIKLPPAHRYRVEVLDTWNMTRETLQTGVSGRVVLTLPGREDMAVLAVRMD